MTGIDASSDLVVTADATTGELKSVTMTDISSTTAIRTESANYSITANDATVLVDASGGAVTVTLPAPIAGRKYVVKKIDGTVNAVNIAGGGNNIDGIATQSTTNPHQTFVLQSDGTNWFIIN